MEAFEIKDLFSLHGHPGVYRFKANLRKGYLFERLTTGKKVTVLNNKGITQFENVGIYIKDQEGMNTLESVIETMYAMADQGIEIPKDLAVIGDRWNDVSDLMEEVVPGYDPDKFKPYHMEKILKWYHEIVEALDQLDEEDPYENVDRVENAE